MKSYQYLNSLFLKIYNIALWLLLLLCFWSTTDWFGEIKQFHEPWNYGARDALAFSVFRSIFKNLKSSFSEESIPVYALDVFIETATNMGCIIPLNTKFEDQTLR